MFDFTDEQKMIRGMLRKWVEAELVPNNERLESGELLPYEPMRKFIRAFQIDQLARAQVERMTRREQRTSSSGASTSGAGSSGTGSSGTGSSGTGSSGTSSSGAGSSSASSSGTGSSSTSSSGAPADGDGSRATEEAMGALVAIEFSRISPGFAMAFGASTGLCGGAILRRGTDEQRRRFALPVLTGERIGAWGMTEPGAGSDAFGGMRTVAKRVPGGYSLSGQKTFISNAPFADTFLIYAKIDDGNPSAPPLRERPFHAFIIEKGATGLAVSKPMKKMGMWASPTGEVFLDDCFVPQDQLLGAVEKEPSRDGARDVFQGERTGMIPMVFGIIERCLEVAIQYAKQRETWGKPIAEYQLVQQKLARMYVHYQNVRNLLFKHLWLTARGQRMTMGEASAAKAYCAPAATEVALDAVQILGGNGYMREYHVEQLARDAKLLQIGGGTDEIQQITCARALLRGDMVL